MPPSDSKIAKSFTRFTDANQPLKKGIPATNKLGGTNNSIAGNTGDSDEQDPIDRINRLEQLLDSEKRRISLLESELKLALASVQQREKAHQNELAGFDGERKKLLAERQTLLNKLGTVDKVEQGVKELYVQMKDRLGDEIAPSPEQLQSEIEALSEENVLVVLGALHAQLKALWAFKVEAEADLVASRQRRNEAAAQQVHDLREAVRKLEGEVRRAHSEAAASNLRADMAQEQCSAVRHEAEAAALEASEQHQQLLAALKSSQQEALLARQAAAAAAAEGKRRDSLVLANRQLESARHWDRVAQDRELRRLQTVHEMQLSAMHQELNRVAELMAENALLQEQLQAAQRKASSLQQSNSGSKIKELEAKIRVLEKQLSAATPASCPSSPYRLLYPSAGKLLEQEYEGLDEDSQSPGNALNGNAGSAQGSPGFHGSGIATTSRPVSAQVMGSRMQGSGVGRSMDSMAARSAKVMNDIRAAAAKALKQKEADAAAEEAVEAAKGMISDVAIMYKAAKTAIKGVEQELHETGYESRKELVSRAHHGQQTTHLLKQVGMQTCSPTKTA